MKRVLIVSLVVMGAVFVSVNLKLVHDRDDCERGEITDLVEAVVISTNRSLVTYLLAGNQTQCSILFVGGNGGRPGETVMVYRSDSGECASHREFKLCSLGLGIFNALFGFICLIVLTIEVAILIIERRSREDYHQLANAENSV